jgi:hypothetical protein
LVAAESSGVDGSWDLTLESPGGPRPSWVKVIDQQSGAAAEFVGITGGKNRASGVEIDGESVRWTIGGDAYTATVADDQLTGRLVRGDQSIPFTGRRVERPTDVTGSWDVELDLGQQVMQRTLTLKKDGNQLSGSYGGEGFPTRELADVELDGNNLTYSFEVEFGDQSPFEVTYDVDVQGDRFEGITTIEGADFEGEAVAVRQREWAEPIELFNGTDLSNWDFQQVGGENQWRVVDGVMVNEAAGWNIFSKQKFSNYKLSIEVKIPPGGNSGIYLNGRYEVQVADGYEKEVSEGGIGAIYGRAAPTANPSKPANEWQKFEIRFVDYWVTVALNGETIVDNVLIEGITGGALDSQESEPGSLMLQGDHGHIEYRNIVITPLAK